MTQVTNAQTFADFEKQGWEQSADTLNAIKNKIITDCERFERNGALYIPMCAVLATATNRFKT